MSGMAEVLMESMDCDVREDSPDCTHDGYCSGHGNITYCTEHDSDEWIDWEAGKLCKYAVSLADMLTAAGFGSVKEAQAVALEEAADAIEPSWFQYHGGRMDMNESKRTWLRARAAAVRGEL